MNTSSHIEQNASAIIELQMISRHLWCDYAWTIRSYVMSSLNELPSAKTDRQWVIDGTDTLGKMIMPYFGFIAGEKLTQLLYSAFSKYDDIIEDIKNGEVHVKLDSIDYAIIVSIAQFLSDHSASSSYDSLVEKVQLLFSLIINLIISVKAEEWQLGMSYHDDIMSAVQDISDTIVKAIIVKRPDLFH